MSSTGAQFYPDKNPEKEDKTGENDANVIETAGIKSNYQIGSGYDMTGNESSSKNLNKNKKPNHMNIDLNGDLDLSHSDDEATFCVDDLGIKCKLGFNGNDQQKTR